MKKIHSHLTRQRHLQFFVALMALGLLVWVAGCSFLKPAESESRYYLLTSAPQHTTTGEANLHARSFVVRLQPVELAEYLQTKDIAVRSRTNEIHFALFHRWAEPLDSGIRRVLAEDLRAMPDIREVLTDQPAPAGRLIYTISVRVLDCGGRISDQQGSTAFEASWEISDPDRRDAILAHGVFRAKPEAWTHGNYSQLAAQLSQSIGNFSAVLDHACSRKVNTSSR